MIKMLVSLFRSESVEQREARLEDRIVEINGKLSRIKNGITMTDPAPLEKELRSLLEQRNKLTSSTKVESKS